MGEQHQNPQHISIIMDGNGRWAGKRKLPRFMGHRAGAKSVRRAIEFCVEHKISYLSLFALSVENRQNRPRKEIQFLLSLFLESLRKHTAELHQNNIRVEVVGNRVLMDDVLCQHVAHTEALTRNNTGLRLILAIDYSGRWDLLQATQRMLAAGLDASQVTEQTFSQYLCFANIPDPDLLIRTSGEQRISNFMLWQLAYTELYFSDLFWPDFDKDELSKALATYRQRVRRFGYTNAQLEIMHA